MEPHRSAFRSPRGRSSSTTSFWLRNCCLRGTEEWKLSHPIVKEESAILRNRRSRGSRQDASGDSIAETHEHKISSGLVCPSSTRKQRSNTQPLLNNHHVSSETYSCVLPRWRPWRSSQTFARARWCRLPLPLNLLQELPWRTLDRVQGEARGRTYLRSSPSLSGTW